MLRRNWEMRPRALVFVLSFPLIAQQSGEYSISGTVLNSLTGEPVKNALVSLNWSGDFREEQRNHAPIHVMTGIGGEFRAGGLAAGQYFMAVQKPGFVQENSPERVRETTIKVAASVSNVQLKLSPLGVIEGRVIDQSGEPQHAISVHVVQPQMLGGWRSFFVRRTVATDDRGMYRVADLMPGKYYVRAAGRIGGTFRYVGDAAPSYISGWEAFAPVYSGGAHDLASATPITIGPGSQATADIELALRPAFRIRGVVSGVSGSDPVTFTLIQGEDEVANRAALNANGKFEVQDVVSGNYTLRVAQGQKIRGEVEVAVKGEDVDGLAVDLAPGVDVKAIVHSPSQPVRPRRIPTSDSLDNGYSTGTTCMVSMQPSGMMQRQIQFNRLSEELVVKNVFPGRYRVDASCQSGYPVSMLSGSTDLLSNPVLTVQPGVAPPPIEITQKSGGGTITAKVEATPLPPTAGVLVVPASNTLVGLRMIPVFAFQQDNPSATAGFLAPGEYTLYLFAQRDEVEYRNPEFLRSLTGGVHARVGDGETQQVTLSSFAK